MLVNVPDFASSYQAADHSWRCYTSRNPKLEITKLGDEAGPPFGLVVH